jgi:Flp pilus assembly pilin Flp
VLKIRAWRGGLAVGRSPHPLGLQRQKKFFRLDAGATTVEYLLIIGVISSIILLLVTGLGENILALFGIVTAAL